MSEQDTNKPQQPIVHQVAHVVRDPFQAFYLNLMRADDSTLASRGGGAGLRIYDEIERDCHAYSVLQKRKMAVVSRPWFVKPASNSRLDRKAADLVKANIEAIQFDRICVDLLDAILKGYAVGEIMWDVEGNEIRATDVMAREQKRFVFDVDYRPRLITLENMLEGEPLPERKFAIHRFGSKVGNPYGLGLGTRLFWPVFFKRQGIQFWLTFCDKFGSPTAVGKYPIGTSDADQSLLVDSMRAIATDAAIAIPADMDVKLLEAARSGSIDTYERLCKYMDGEISKATLGETLSTEIKGGGSLAASRTHNEVRLELVQADADLLTDTLRSTLVRWLVEYNLPGAGIPSVNRDVRPAEDLAVRAERDVRIQSLGFRPTLDYVTEVYGDGWEDDPAARRVADASNGQLADGSTDFAEPHTFGDQAALDAAVAALPGEPGETLKALLAPALKAIQEAATPDEAMDALLEAYPNLQTDQLEAILARAFFVSDLWGMLSSRQQVVGA
ncbi:hypothetical protein B7R77_03020 [Ralstonia solanacearum K60]|uniref:Mu-like prophage FluMu protein gp29 n=1 Tax=Ralstonia solanacearum K60 TaxID=1091042 RepID=A0AAP7ZKP6_RALSL|nr:DUF935 family protein [Ralstonia solanacearum]OYQ12326.1 hypothetical protein B7R77_03020 [Ralstonia solanacearum K60]CCF96526.1 putative phage protein [Ralstonia solanacearum K60]